MDDTTDVSGSLALDVERLETYLHKHLPDFAGPLQVRRFKGGQSNPTYLLQTPRRNYVLRRKPPGQLLASAHAVDREYRVLTALSSFTDVPVPRTYLLCTDESIIGTWFYVMDHVVGRVFWDSTFPEITRNQRRDYYDAMNGAIASLHRVVPADVGLADFGKSNAYMARQIARWSKQYREDEAAGRIESLDRLVEWLPANLPSVEPAPAVVHGDYRADNLMFHPTEPRVIAILDWELSTIGDPIADFAYHVMTYRMPTTALPGLLHTDLDALGLPHEDEYVARYCERTGRDGIPDLDFYVAFCMFKLAGIFHGIRGRVIRGTAVSEKAREYAKHVETIADVAWRQAERARV